MIVLLLAFSWYYLNYDGTFKMINRLKINNDNFKFKGNFKSHITIERTSKRTFEEHLTFPISNR